MKPISTDAKSTKKTRHFLYRQAMLLPSISDADFSKSSPPEL